MARISADQSCLPDVWDFKESKPRQRGIFPRKVSKRKKIYFYTSFIAKTKNNFYFSNIDGFQKFAFSTVGLLPTNSIKYEDFEFEGKKVFSGMGPENQEITFMRKKFFQSSLNYII